jgi:hypothetical protein
MIMTSEPIEVDESTVHSVLNYCLTMAVQKQKNFSSRMQVPYEVLAMSNGITKEEAIQHLGSALEISITLKWVEFDFEDVEVTNE